MMNPSRLLEALAFAATRHRNQRRKDASASPYINHPIAVATMLATAGHVQDGPLLMAAVLHDTVEDTRTTPREIKAKFGAEVASLVRELTDNKKLAREVRKRLQIEHAAVASPRAKQLKIADKICNIEDIAATPPTGWSKARKREYLDWAEQVVAGCRGVNPRLDARFDQALRRARKKLRLKTRD